MRKMVFIIFALTLTGSCQTKKEEVNAPNVILILADDLGYGDIQAFHTDSEIPTPNLNKFSEEGIMFTDFHTPSSVCTPTRYGLLTGRYCWRTSMKKGVLFGYSPPLIQESRITIADYLKERGYKTGIVGKWHLGLGFQKGPNSIEKGFDLTKKLTNSPNNHGFDYSFVHPASLDMSPYVYVRNYEVVETEFESVQKDIFPNKLGEGIKSKSLEFDRVQDDLLEEAKNFIINESKSEKPFFLYFPLTAPHVPLVPGKKFAGTSDKGMYGDFTIQVDWTAGEIFKLLEQLDLVENTLVIFTSDNGSAMRRIDSGTGPDHIDDPALRYYNASSHQSNGLFRGLKGDAYEGGHRVPLIVRWPARFSGDKKINEAICMTDIFETLVEATGGVKPEGSAEDSYSFWPILTGEKETVNRPPIIHHSGGVAMYAIRSGNWKLILGNGSGARTKPVGKPFQKPFQLFNLENDVTESKNLIEEKAGIANKIETEFFTIKGKD